MKTQRHGRRSAAAKYRQASWRRLHADSSRQAVARKPAPAPARVRFWLRLGIAGLLCLGAVYLGSVSLNILILGTDEADISQHMDTIMLVHWRPLPRRLSLLSVPRNTLVMLPKRGPIKINAVYAYGQALNGRPFALAMTRASVENLIGLKIHYILHARYGDFSRLVDDLGGIPCGPPGHAQPQVPSGSAASASERGGRLCNGAEAVSYLRWRDEPDGDLSSCRRQQELLQALFSRASRLSRWPAAARALFPFLRRAETNLSWVQALFLALEMQSAPGLPWQQGILPGRPAYLEGTAYWQPDVEAVRSLAAGLGRTAPSPPARPTASAEAAAAPEAGTQGRAEEAEPAADSQVDGQPTAVATPAGQSKPAPTPAALKTNKTKTVPASKASLNPPAGQQPRVRILNGCGVQGVCRLAADKLGQRSIRILPQDVTNGPSFKVNRSIVKTSRQNLEWARTVAGILGLDRNIQIVPDKESSSAVTVIVGKDYQEWLK